MLATRDPVTSGFRGAAVPMAPATITATAARWGCEEAVVRAVLDIESSGSGFDTGHRPKALFERHWFYRKLQATPDVQALAVKQLLAYPVQGTLPYPKTSDGVYDEVTRACALDPVAALQSTSWGIAQVMGFNHSICGYGDVVPMVLDAMDSEAKQFGFLVSYMESQNLIPALRAKDFLTVATRYNGPGAAPAYAAKLRGAYAHHAQPVAAIKPTPLQTMSQPWSFDRPALNPRNQLNDEVWLSIRAGQGPSVSADQLNYLELQRIRGGLL